MELRTRSHKTRIPRLSNTCAQCGDLMFLPEWSEYVRDQRVRHLGVCDACGSRFETIDVFSES